MNRMYDLMRRHPRWVDGFWGFVLLVPGLLWGLGVSAEHAGPRPVVLGVTLAMGTVVILRRVVPAVMLGLALATGVLQVVADVPPVPANFALLVIIFTVASRPDRRASAVALAMAVLAPAVAMARWWVRPDAPVLATVFELLLLTVCFLLAWVLGDSLRTRRAYYAELEQRAARLERERAARERIAVAAERARIARELHDVVAHNVSVMVVQADGAAYVLDSAPAQARDALRTISCTGREALDEMRRLIGVLGEGTDEGGNLLPQPGVEQVADLVQQVRDAGLPVDFRVEGTPRPLPGGVDLTAYRIVQEALTNTRKHAGPTPGALVRLRYAADALRVLVEDDGRGSVGTGPAPDAPARPGAARVTGARPGAPRRDGPEGEPEPPGSGLIGMRERVGMVGGTLEAGPRPGGGYRISAVLPLPAGGGPGGGTVPGAPEVTEAPKAGEAPEAPGAPEPRHL
ncbi:sensor histidine kinase, partial [Streptomyces calidiresistens]